MPIRFLRRNVEIFRNLRDGASANERRVDEIRGGSKNYRGAGGGGGEEKMVAPSFRNSMYNFSISKYKLIDCTIVGFETSVALYAPHKPL